MKRSGKRTRKTGESGCFHLVRLGDLAYTRLLSVYAGFVKKVAANPHLYPGYCDRRVTISEVVAIIAEEYQCRLNENVQE